MWLILVFTAVLLCGCRTEAGRQETVNGEMVAPPAKTEDEQQAKEEGGTVAGVPGQGAERPPQEKHGEQREPDEWGPTAENTAGPRPEALDEEALAASYALLDQWVTAYVEGQYCQIYICNINRTRPEYWRLTCYGDGPYSIETQSGPDGSIETYWSGMVTEGMIYYAFGGDVPQLQAAASRPPLVWKGWEGTVFLAEDTEEWRRQAVITAEQAEQMAADILTAAGEPGAEEATFLTRERLAYLGQCFYRVEAYGSDGGYECSVLVSADGMSSFYSSAMGGTLELLGDGGAWSVTPGSQRADRSKVWEERREKAPYVASGMEEYLGERGVGLWPYGEE